MRKQTPEDPRTQVRGFALSWAIVPTIPIALAIATLVFACLALAPGARAATPQTATAAAAVTYIRSLQNADGGFPSFGTDSSPGGTLDATFALVAAGLDAGTVANGGDDVSTYLSGQAAAYATDPGAAAKLSLGVSAIGLDPASFGGVDLLAAMDAAYDTSTGAYGLDTFDEAFYVLALLAGGEPVPAGVVAHLQSAQAADGGWEFLPGFGTDTNTTSLVVQALIAAGVPKSDASITGALAYIAASQNVDAGFPYSAGFDSDPSSTAFVIQALVAAGEDIDAGGPWEVGGATPMDSLLSAFNPATGAFQAFGGDSAFATYQAVPALLLAPFPDLVTLPDGEPPAEATPEPTATVGPSPTATAVAGETQEPTVLPDASGAPGGDDLPLVLAVAGALMASGAAAAGLARPGARRRG